ncbi:hypothetical protein [Cellulomonas edaphi]|uniref:Integral membrane protein n=1 Tax=Cellulomonas edaphi TaxID=3053468 RepID=A0ABT7S764_9CELL|nr:hypothetical protein [Cellulomons edaphi]MDM7831465.1 hypothetical protein [Cellulomons edaphi]
MTPPSERKPRRAPGGTGPAAERRADEAVAGDRVPPEAPSGAGTAADGEPDEPGTETPADERAADVADAHPTEADTLVIDVPAASAAADEDVAARLAKLEAENAALRRRLSEVPATTAPVAVVRAPRHRVRQWTAVVLVAIGALLAPLGLVASWAERTLTDTDRYLETVAPLADDPQVQQAIINRTVNTVMDRIDVSTVTDELQQFLVQQGAPPALTERIELLDAPLTSGIETLVTKTVTRFVQSDAFSTMWTQINRTAQTQIVAVLNGDPNTVVQLDDEGELSLQLGPVIEIVKQQLVEAGLGVASLIPDANPVIPIAQADSLVQLRTAYNVLDTLGDWLPWIALMFLVAGVAVSTTRLRTTAAAALALVGGMALLAVGLAVGKEAILGSIPATASGGAVTVLYETIVHFMKVTIRVVAIIGLVVAFFSFIAGGSAAAIATRRSAGSGFETIRSWGRGRGVDTGGFGVWLGARRTLLRWVVIALGVLVIIAADEPTVGLVVWTTVGVLVVMGILELLSASPERPSEAQIAPCGSDRLLDARPGGEAPVLASLLDAGDPDEDRGVAARVEQHHGRDAAVRERDVRRDPGVARRREGHDGRRRDHRAVARDARRHLRDRVGAGRREHQAVDPDDEAAVVAQARIALADHPVGAARGHRGGPREEHRVAGQASRDRGVQDGPAVMTVGVAAAVVATGERRRGADQPGGQHHRGGQRGTSQDRLHRQPSRREPTVGPIRRTRDGRTNGSPARAAYQGDGCGLLVARPEIPAASRRTEESR